MSPIIEKLAAENAELREQLATALDALINALPWVEANLDDPVNKPGAVQRCAEKIRAAIAKVEGGAS